MLTIFSTSRPFRGEFNLIQRNAIQSWIFACPGCEIILVGDDEETDKAAADFKIKHIPKVEKNEKGVLLRNSIFLEAQKAAQNELICFVNADIILTSDFLRGVKSIELPYFLLSGRRWNLNIKEAIDFNDPAWEEKLRQRIKKEGKLHTPSANDYFVFPRSLKLNMPPFSVKHGGWDNWFIYRFKSLGIPIIDATQAITVLHQNHNGSHSKETRRVWRKEDGKKELKLAGGFTSLLTLRDADFLLSSDYFLKKPNFPRQILAKLSLFYPWRLLLAIKRKIQQYL